jgi:hypothetical protein
MIRHLLALLSILCLALPTVARPAAPDPVPATSFSFGSRPATSVFDQPGTLPAARVDEISAELGKIRAEEGLDVIVVILKTLDGAPPKQLAQRFAEAWCNPLFHSVVLYVPGDQRGPWIVPGGKLLRLFAPEAVKETVAQAQRRASCEVKEDDKVRAAATEASDMLRIWAGDGAYWTLQHNAELQRRQMGWLGRHTRQLLLPAAVLLLALAGGVWLAVRRFKRNRRRHFPEPDWKIRLGAPYAGGNDGTVTCC